MTTPVVFPNAEVAVRDWLRGQDPLLTVLGQPSTIDLQPDDTLPCLVVYRAGGRPDPYVPLVNAAMSFDCWGPGQSRSRGKSMEIRDALLGVLWSMAAVTLAPGVRGDGAQIESDLWFPDPSGRARYVVTAMVQLRSSALAA